MREGRWPVVRGSEWSCEWKQKAALRVGEDDFFARDVILGRFWVERPNKKLCVCVWVEAG